MLDKRDPKIEKPAQITKMDKPVPKMLTNLPSDYGNCASMLNLGHWKDQNLNHTNCQLSEACKSTAWEPYNCRWHSYTKTDALSCLINKKIQVLGDSRGRQMYLALKDRFLNLGWAFDDMSFKEKIEKSKDWILTTPVSSHNLILRWDWYTGLGDTLLTDKDWIEDINSESFPDLLIFESLLLHPTRNCDNDEVCDERFEMFKKRIEEQIIPFMKKVVHQGKPDSKIIWMGNEDLKHHEKTNKTRINNCNRVRQKSDVWMRKIFYEKFTREELQRVAFVGAAADTAWTKDGRRGELMMSVDRTHLMVRSTNTTMPDSLWTDANLILNFACNDVLRPEGATCCM